MTVPRVRAVLSIMVFIVFLGVSGVIALVPIVGAYPAGEYTEHLKTFASLYSGIVGVIVGFYFGQQVK